MNRDRSHHAEHFTICQNLAEHILVLEINVNTLRNTHTKFGSNWSGSVRGEVTLKNNEKMLKKSNNSTWHNRFTLKFNH